MTTPEFNYSYNSFNKNGGSERSNNGLLDCSNRYCQCGSCAFCSSYYYGAVFAFFRGLKEEHYQQLMIHVFLPLANLPNLEFQSAVNRHALSRLKISVPTNSAFYSDARRHLSSQIKNNIDDLLERLEDYNKRVDLLDPTMTSRINGIINTPMPGPLRETYIPTIYQIARAAFEEVVLDTEREIQDVFRTDDMRRKVRLNGTGAYGFIGEEHRAINILNTIEANSQIRQELQSLRNMIVDIRLLMNNISGHASGIIKEINEKRYHKKKLCCPSLIKELWHSFI